MRLIGLCGGSGSGKGSVCEIFLRLGVPSLDLDALYHSLISHDTPCVRELVSEFGDEILSGGKIDRKALGRIVFSDERKRQRLNSIAHKHVIKETERLITSQRALGFDYLIIDAPLLFEAGYDKRCDLVIAVIADTEKRLDRIVARDGISREAALTRINTQISNDELIKKCHYIIYNNSDLTSLEEEVGTVFNKIRAEWSNKNE